MGFIRYAVRVFVLGLAVLPLVSCGSRDYIIIDDVNPLEVLDVELRFDQDTAPPVEVTAHVLVQTMTPGSARIHWGEGDGWVSVEVDGFGTIAHTYQNPGEYRVVLEAVGSRTGRLFTEVRTIRIGPADDRSPQNL